MIESDTDRLVKVHAVANKHLDEIRATLADIRATHQEIAASLKRMADKLCS